MDLHELAQLDELQSIVHPTKTPAYIHKEHRFCLPLLFKHQQEGHLPKPCQMILFDRHHDLAAVNSDILSKVKTMKSKGFTLNELLLLCKDDLRQDDSDWILTGMELGMIADMVSFGVEDSYEWDENSVYEDHTGVIHQIKVLCCGPGEMLGHKGNLSDIAEKNVRSDLWEILQWEFISKQGFRFKKNRTRFWLNIDLDCFAIAWQGFTFPWLDEVFIERYAKPSDYWSTRFLTGKKFFQGLFDATGLLTIATEPLYCGGEEKAQEIFDKVNLYLFDKELKVQPFE